MSNAFDDASLFEFSTTTAAFIAKENMRKRRKQNEYFFYEIKKIIERMNAQCPALNSVRLHTDKGRQTSEKFQK